MCLLPSIKLQVRPNNTKYQSTLIPWEIKWSPFRIKKEIYFHDTDLDNSMHYAKVNVPIEVSG